MGDVSMFVLTARKNNARPKKPRCCCNVHWCFRVCLNERRKVGWDATRIGTQTLLGSKLCWDGNCIVMQTVLWYMKLYHHT